MASLKFRGNVRVGKRKRLQEKMSRARPLTGVQWEPERYELRVDSPDVVKEQVDMGSAMHPFSVPEVLAARALGKPVSRRAGFSTRNLRDVVFRNKIEELREEAKVAEKFRGHDTAKRKKYLRSFPKPDGKVYHADKDEYVHPDRSEVFMTWTEKGHKPYYEKKPSVYAKLAMGKTTDFQGTRNLPNSVLNLQQQAQTGNGQFFKVYNVARPVKVGPFLRRRHVHR